MKKAAIILSSILLMSASVWAQKSEVFIKNDAAIRGYDPVAYFTAGKPVKGDAKFSYTWNGAKWQFASQQNLDAFKASPEKYAPQYGGYCAYGLAQGHKAPTDPDAWTILNNKLYLNYDKDVQEKWNKDRQKFIVTADKNWPTVKKQE